MHSLSFHAKFCSPLKKQILKRKKLHKDLIKQQRVLFQNTTVSADEDMNNDSITEYKEGEISSVTDIFQDDSTLSMFGSTVSVTVNALQPDTTDNDHADSIVDDMGKSNNNKKSVHRIRLQKALKSAKIQMVKKKKTTRRDISKNDVEGFKKSNSTKSSYRRRKSSKS